MDGRFDTAGIVFAALVIVGAIPLALAVVRRREPDDPVSRFASRALVVAAILNGVVNVIRHMGLMPDDPTYQTLDISTLTLYGIMMWLFLRRNNRRWKKDSPA
jgi:peptidoglycan/LPS O-acetylase OafA/YrhL